MDKTWDEMWRLFHLALEAPEGATAWLETHCQDENLRAEVAELVRAHVGADPQGDEGGDDKNRDPREGTGGATDGAAIDRAPTLPDFHGQRSRAYGPGDLIGVYRLEEILGEGGMGRVFLAQQLEPIERKVALKVIKRGLDSDEIVARFHGERQILARMVHPSIATTFDAGITADGRPYFVMEHLDGAPIDRYCDARALAIEDRIRLVQDVCAAVQHAHQKGIVHRDLKPSNILVVEIDGKPVPKVIDFGIAKAIGEHAAVPRTRHGDLLGTPDFMSPEQATFETGDVDSRADVYAIGVMLYFLLIGAIPFKRGLLQLVARREAPPPAPTLTRRLDSMGDEGAETVALERGCTVKELRRQLEGDLEWITARAMDVDRERRYASCSELAADLGRFLLCEPVLAGPPSARYRVGKFVERHKLEVALAALALVVLAGLVSGLGVQTLRLQGALAESRLEQERLRQTSAFLVDLFEVADPESEAAAERTALSVLDSGAERVLDSIEDPAVYTPLVESLGRIYGNLGEYQRSAELFGDVVRRQAARETPPLDQARSHHLLGRSLIPAGKWNAAERHLRLALDLRREHLGAHDLETLSTERELVGIWVRRGRDDEALPFLERILAAQLAAGAAELEITETWRFLGAVHYGAERFDQAAEAFQEALDLTLEHLPEDDRRIFKLANPLAISLERIDRLEEAEATYRRTIEHRLRRVDAKHPDIGHLRLNLGLLQLRQGRYREAEHNMRAGYLTVREKLGEQSPLTLHAQLNWASSLYLTGKHLSGTDLSEQERLANRERAIDLLIEVENRLMETLGPDDAKRLSAGAVLAHHLLDERRFLEAENAIRPIHEIRLRTPDHPATARAASLLGAALAGQGRHAEAEPFLLSALEAQLATIGPEHRQTRDTWRRLSSIPGADGRFGRWRRHFESAEDGGSGAAED